MDDALVPKHSRSEEEIMLFYGGDLFVLKVLSAPIQTDGFHIKECDCVYLPSAASWHDCETHLYLKALER